MSLSELGQLIFLDRYAVKDHDHTHLAEGVGKWRDLTPAERCQVLARRIIEQRRKWRPDRVVRFHANELARLARRKKAEAEWAKSANKAWNNMPGKLNIRGRCSWQKIGEV